MEAILRSPVTFLFLIGLFLILFAWTGVLAYNFSKFRHQLGIVTRGMGRANLEEVILRHVQRIDELEKRLAELESSQQIQGRSLLSTLKHVGLVRFNAFGDVGGELSFAAALLDDHGNGLVFSTISGRTETRTYAKLVEGGKSQLALSDEEYRAIQQAMG
jgi:hypothetical protein